MIIVFIYEPLLTSPAGSGNTCSHQYSPHDEEDRPGVGDDGGYGRCGHAKSSGCRPFRYPILKASRSITNIPTATGMKKVAGPVTNVASAKWAAMASAACSNVFCRNAACTAMPGLGSPYADPRMSASRKEPATCHHPHAGDDPDPHEDVGLQRKGQSIAKSARCHPMVGQYKRGDWQRDAASKTPTAAPRSTPFCSRASSSLSVAERIA